PWQTRVVTHPACSGVCDAHVPFDSLDLDALFVGDAEDPAGGLLREAGRVVSWFGARDATYARRLPALIRDAIVASSVDRRGGLVWEHLVKTVGGDVADDSGISHLAAALGVPSVVLFAPENVAWRPWGASARAVVVGRTPQDDDITAVVAAVRDRLVFRGAS